MNRATEEGRAGFETLVGQIMEHYDAAGMAVAVIDDKETLYQQFFGYRDVEEQVELNENTIMGGMLPSPNPLRLWPSCSWQKRASSIWMRR